MNEKLSELQDELKSSAQKIWLAGLGALSMAGEEGKKLFETLVEKGESFEAKDKPSMDAVKRTVDNAKGKAEDLWSRFEGMFNEKIAHALQKAGVPSKEEITQLTQRVDSLMEAINKLNEAGPKK